MRPRRVPEVVADPEAYLLLAALRAPHPRLQRIGAAAVVAAEPLGQRLQVDSGTMLASFGVAIHVEAIVDFDQVADGADAGGLAHGAMTVALTPCGMPRRLGRAEAIAQATSSILSSTASGSGISRSHIHSGNVMSAMDRTASASPVAWRGATRSPKMASATMFTAIS